MTENISKPHPPGPLRAIEAKGNKFPIVVTRPQWFTPRTIRLGELVQSFNVSSPCRPSLEVCSHLGQGNYNVVHPSLACLCRGPQHGGKLAKMSEQNVLSLLAAFPDIIIRWARPRNRAPVRTRVSYCPI